MTESVNRHTKITQPLIIERRLKKFHSEKKKKRP